MISLQAMVEKTSNDIIAGLCRKTSNAIIAGNGRKTRLVRTSFKIATS